MRQPSDAGSMRGPPPPDAYGIPPSPGLNGSSGFGHPMQKQLNQNNTIVPNKSTMVEEDDDGDSSYALGSNRESKRSAGGSEVRHKLERLEIITNLCRLIRNSLRNTSHKSRIYGIGWRAWKMQ
jgi:hypothetical protein